MSISRETKLGIVEDRFYIKLNLKFCFARPSN